MKPLCPIGPQAPPSRANSAVMPPRAGPIESTVSTWPSHDAERGEGDQTEQDQPVMVAHRLGDRWTPSETPAAQSNTMLTAAMAYPVITLARK